LGSDPKRLRGIYLEMTRFFSKEIKKALFSRKTDKVPEDQGDELRTQVSTHSFIQTLMEAWEKLPSFHRIRVTLQVLDLL
jgi:hypothetical protein